MYTGSCCIPTCTFIPYCSSYEGSGIHDDLKSRKYLQCEEVLWPMTPQSQTGAEVVRFGRLQLLVQVWIWIRSQCTLRGGWRVLVGLGGNSRAQQKQLNWNRKNAVLHKTPSAICVWFYLAILLSSSRSGWYKASCFHREIWKLSRFCICFADVYWYWRKQQIVSYVMTGPIQQK